MRFHIHWLPFLLAAVAFAAKPLGDQVCVAACYNALLKARYSAASDKAQTACTNPLRVRSTYYCISEHCAREGDAATETGIAWWAGACKNSSKVVNVAGYRAATANVTQEYLEGLPRANQKDKTVFDGPALPSQANWEYMYRTVFTYADMRRYNDAIRWSLYGFWGRLGKVALEKQTGELRTGRKLSKWLNIHLFQAPTLTHHHHEPWGWFTLPLRAHTIVIVSYIVLQFAVVASRYHIYDENNYFKSRQTQTLRYLADRLGTIMAASLPFIFLFGARSSPLPVLTGWSYRTFSAFHRWVAVVMLVESICHGCAFSAFYVGERGWPDYRKRLKTDVVFRSGIFMLVALGLSASLAHIKIRQMAYEAFKMAHIAMAIIFLANYYDHIKDKFAGDYKVWTWVCVGIWASDYLFRIVRIICVNFNAFLGKDSRAIASYSEETGMIRLQIHSSAAAAAVKQSPGTYYYLHFGGWRIWENHPFSLASCSSSAEDTATTTAAALAESSSSDEKHSAAVSTQPKGTEAAPRRQSSYNKTFMIRPRNGFTRRLRDSIIQQQQQGSSSGAGMCRLRVVLEGPYGTAANITGFSEILFIAGGSGITAILPYVRRIFEDTAQGDDALSCCPGVRLVWVAREAGFALDVLANELRRVEASPMAAAKFRMDIYITSRTTAGDETAGGGGGGGAAAAEKSDSETSGASVPGSVFTYGRPAVSEVVREYVEGMQSNRAAVFVCGPARMADETRAAVRKEARASAKDVEIFEEMYGW